MENNTARNLADLVVVKNLDENSFNAIKYALLVSPEEITNEMSWWQEQLKGANNEYKAECELMLKKLRAIRINNINLTCRVYDLDVDATADKSTAKPAEDKKDNKKSDVKPATGKVENNQSAQNVNTIEGTPVWITDLYTPNKKTVEELKVELKKRTKDEAIAAATIILGKARYAKSPGQKVKPWNPERIAKFVDGIFELDAPANKDTKETEKPKESENKKQTIEETYATDKDNITILGVTKKICEMITAGKDPKEISEFATYILGGGFYTDKQKEDDFSTADKIAEFIAQSAKDLEDNSASTAKEKDIEKKFDISFADAVRLMESLVNQGKSSDEVKKHFESLNKVIESFSDAVAKDGFESAWNTCFKLTTENRVESYNKAKENSNKPEAKQEVINEVEKELKDKKEAIESGEESLREAHLTSSILKKLREKGFSPTVPEGKAILHDLAVKIGLNVKWLKPKSESQLPATEVKTEPKAEQKAEPAKEDKKEESKESPVIGDNSTLDTSKYPEIATELGEKQTMLSASIIIRKYESDADKKSVVCQLVTKMFAEKKIFPTDKADAKPMDWDQKRIESWINSVLANKQAVDKTQKPKEPEVKNEDNKEDKKDETPTEPAAETKVDQPKPAEKKVNFLDKHPIFKTTKTADEFKTAVTNTLNKLLTEEKLNQEDALKELIGTVRKATDMKKTYAQQQYKNKSNDIIKAAIVNIAESAGITLVPVTE
jgi:hypothetical protein